MQLKDKQTPKAKTWFDETGAQVPYLRTTKSERMRETMLYSLAKEAMAINQQMVAFKAKLRQTIEDIAMQIIEENKGTTKPNKGNVILYNFDGSIKVEVNISDRIEFDSVLLDMCKQKLDELLNNNLSSSDEFIKQIVLGAFETSRGKIDTKKVLSLKRYASRITNPLYQEAMQYLDKAIRRPESKAYYQVWLKDDNGQYKAINLNFGAL